MAEWKIVLAIAGRDRQLGEVEGDADRDAARREHEHERGAGHPAEHDLPGAQNSRPTTSGSSPKASVWELRRKCTWTTEISVTAKASASAHQGICTDGTGDGQPDDVQVERECPRSERRVQHPDGMSPALSVEGAP